MCNTINNVITQVFNEKNFINKIMSIFLVFMIISSVFTTIAVPSFASENNVETNESLYNNEGRKEDHKDNMERTNNADADNKEDPDKEVEVDLNNGNGMAYPLYSFVLPISTALTIVSESICACMYFFSSDGRKVESAGAWMKRIAVGWICINCMGIIMSLFSETGMIKTEHKWA